jgi:RNA polymerase sigma-70 factor, ECF subfamily
MDEQQAIAQLKNGNLAGLEFLVHRYQVQAVHTAYLITGDRAAAEDIVQTAFLRLIDKIGLFDDHRNFRPWFLRSVVNDCIKEVNRSGRNISIDDQNEPISNWLFDEGPKPEELAEASETRDLVWNALQQLPPEQRAVIVQRHFLEMKEAEIVESLKRPASTIKWWLHMARNRLRSILSMHRDE